MITQITFVIGDAAELFYDFDAFGILLDAAPHIEHIANANQLDRPMPIGSHPEILYFAGRRNIIEAQTVLGTVRAQHNPRLGSPGPRGVRIDNAISVSIQPDAPIAFDEATVRTIPLLRFLEVIIGRPQELRDVTVTVTEHGQHDVLRVHWSHPPSPGAKANDRHSSPQPADLLLDPVNRSAEFATVLRTWLALDAERRDARGQFHASFANQRRYSIERLVSAANMFDLLPGSAAPKDVELSADLIEAKRRCEEIFRALPESDERSSVLSSLGRVGKASLKRKVRQRARLVLGAVGDRFSDLELVLNQAVDCRNHYVHGSPTKIDYSEHPEIVTFFTDTLEFVFAAAELLECGWDIRTFLTKGTTMSHPFGGYRVEYEMVVRSLKQLMANAGSM